MPIHDNSIGSATFFDLVGVFSPSQDEYEVIARPGVDGTGARNTCKRGQPFELTSIAYHDSFDDAASALDGNRRWQTTTALHLP